ncbi:MAG: hypothetical protein QN163_08625 [Armatimonadota bacterium]|nr:hypothetical protein [Armatimonadota bacterium]
MKPAAMPARHSRPIFRYSVPSLPTSGESTHPRTLAYTPSSVPTTLTARIAMDT